MRVYGSKANRLLVWVLTYLAIAAVVLFFFFPVFWELLVSFKAPQEVLSERPSFLFTPTLANWARLLSSGILHNFANSLIVVAGSTFLACLLGALAGYALARGRMKSRRGLAMEFLTLRMLPPVAMIVPIFVLFQQLKLLNTYLGLILMYTTANLPLSVWLMMGFFEGIPKEIAEAATVDGCGRLRIWGQVELPLALPGVITTAIFCVIFSWNEYLFGVILTRIETATLTVETAREVLQRTGINWSSLASLSVFTVLVPLIFALSIQKKLVRGLTMGAVK